MSKHTWIRLGLAVSLIAQALVSLAVPATASASPQELSRPRTVNPAPVARLRPIAPPHPVNLPPPVPGAAVPQTNDSSDTSAPLLDLTDALTVSIISAPWAPIDNNLEPGGPRAFVVEAVVTNTSQTVITDVIVDLYYGNSGAWHLVEGEEPVRPIGDLAPDEAHYVYWFASYPLTPTGSTHDYTVTVSAPNFTDTVATSKNYYENPDGHTLKTRKAAETGSQGATDVSARVVVGVFFTITVDFELSQNPDALTFSPVGNTDFDPDAYRLLETEIIFYDGDGVQTGQPVEDHLYFPIGSVPGDATRAEVTYTFIALAPKDTRLCPYTVVDKSNTHKYDNGFCSGLGLVHITGTVTLSMTKQVSHIDTQQGESLFYTITITSPTDSPALTQTWVWDDLPPGIGTIAATSPNINTSESHSERVAWYLADGIEPGYTGVFTITLSGDGQGDDLDDGTDAVNHASFGISPTHLPTVVALTSTVTTTIHAPTISITKTDGRTTVQAYEPLNRLTYTLRITNSGSMTATGVVITDELPSYVTLAGAPTPPTYTLVGDRTLVWTTSIPRETGTFVVTIPVTVGLKTPHGTTLVNRMTVEYQNMANYTFDTKTATDTTDVEAPVLSISKSGPDTVLAGRLITYTLDYANIGPVAATNVVITDRVPISTTYQTCSAGDGITCTLISGVGGRDVVSWTIGPVLSGASGTVGFSVRVTDTTGAIKTGDLIVNDDYGISADQADFIPGLPVTTVASLRAAIIEGYTFIDYDCDGEYDEGSGDAPLGNITVTLAHDSTTLVTPTHPISGFYHFRIEDQVPVSVAAALAPNYFRTTPGTIFLETILEYTHTINFGYAPVAAACGVIYGTVFEDINHDGTRDLSEEDYGLSGVTITSFSTVPVTDTTDEHGAYTLNFGVFSGTVTVTETNPYGYVSTTPDVVPARVVTGSSAYTLSQPVDFGDFLGLMVTGTIFYDDDVDGVRDVGESAVGVPVTVTAFTVGDSDSLSTTGVYTLYVAVHDSDWITIAEEDASGYVSTNAIPRTTDMIKVDANTLRITSPTSGTIYSGDFGDVLASSVITISGQVWNDNGACAGCLANGQLDSGEPGLPGAVVSLSSGMTQTTASDGLFLLYARPNEVIIITETNPTGYVSTNAIPGNDATKLDHDTLIVSALGEGSTSAGNLFGDVEASRVALITGTVFYDENESGTFDVPGEEGIPGVTVTLEISGGNTIPTTTDPDGGYQFPVAPGTYVFISSAKPDADFYHTTPATLPARPAAAGVYRDYNFGFSNDPNVAIITGIVFDDWTLPTNGELDAGELGLAGAVITLSQNSSVVSVIETTGNGVVTGTFTFSVTQPLTEPVFYRVQEKDPPGYRSTSPNDLIIKVISTTNRYEVNFGDLRRANPAATVYGVVFYDHDGDGVRDSEDEGLPGVNIYVPGTGKSTITKSYGQFAFGIVLGLPGYYTIVEQDPAKEGFHSTTPDEITIYARAGQDYEISYGDTDTDIYNITGIVFNDEDGSGVQNDEEGIEGVTVEISLLNGMTAATTTGDFGAYTFPISPTDVPTYVLVMETDPDGYRSTTPNTVTVYITETQRVYYVHFGDSDNLLLSSIFGTVFDDRNGDGSRDPTIELGLKDITVTITSTLSIASDPQVATDDWGQYTFQIIYTGTYTVTETDFDGYVSTNAIPGTPGDVTNVITKVDNNTLRADINSLGKDVGGNLFGDAFPVDFSSATYSVDEDVGTATITVTLGAASDLTVTVDYATSDGTATDSDYTSASGTLTFTPGTTELIFTVPINDDVLDEDSETVNLTLSNAHNATIVPGTNNPATLTIVDNDDPPNVHFNSSTYSVGESDGTATITVTLDAESGKTVTVTYSTSDGTATAGEDYDSASGTLTFNPGNTSETFAVTITHDTKDELDETVNLALNVAGNATITSPSTAILTITDDDDPPTVDFESAIYTVVEDEGPATITVTLSAVSGLTITVNYATSDDTATAGDDYTAASGTLTFTAGVINQTFIVPITSDLLDENDEDVTLTLLSANNAYTGTTNNPATLTITDDDDPPTVDFDNWSYNVEEDDPAGARTITVTLDALSGLTVTVDYTTTAGTATVDDDYTAASGTLTFTPGTTELTFTVTINDDGLAEPNETVILTLFNESNAILGTNNPATLYIIDNESTRVDFDRAAYSVDEGVDTATITVTLNTPSASPITVTYSTSDGTALAGSDYTFASDTLTFTPGMTVLTFTVPITDDALDEDNEYLMLTLTDVTSGTNIGANNPARLTIVDNDDPPNLSIDDVFVIEGDTGTADAVFTVSLDAPSGLPISVDYATADDTATAPVDYTAIGTTQLDFAPGETSKQITVTVLGDTLDEGASEAFNVNLTNPTNVTITDAQGVGTITDDDESTVDFNSDTYTVGEDTGPAIITVTLTGDTVLTVMVNYTTSDGTATAGSDYATVSDTLTFTPGTTVLTFTVPVTDDALYENTETVNLELSSPVNTNLGNYTATLRILDNTANFATIYGFVFEDINRNRERDTGESGIPNARITLDDAITATTEADGYYFFSTAITGFHTVVETDPDGYVSITDNEVDVDVALGNNYEVNFGDIPVCICPSGDDYEDDDDPTQASPIQIGYAYSQTHDFCDDATDWITFTAQTGDIYTITTSSWGQRADTFLALFDTDAQTPLAANDDYTGTTDYSSRIVWQAHADGVYFVNITNQAGLFGCDTDYHVWVERQDFHYLYLPVVMRNHAAAGDGAHALLHPSQRVLDTEATSTSTATGPSAPLNPTGVISHTCPDAYDEPPDDTWENARPIEIGVVQVHSFDSDPVDYAADKDYVWFDVPELHVSTGKTITFTVTAVTHTQTLMQLHYKDGYALPVATGASTLTWAPDAAGRYYLSVSPEEGIFTFGCVNEAGYNLLLTMEEIQNLYLPVTMRNY